MPYSYYKSAARLLHTDLPVVFVTQNVILLQAGIVNACQKERKQSGNAITGSQQINNLCNSIHYSPDILFDIFITVQIMILIRFI